MDRKNDWGEFPLVTLACPGHFEVVIYRCKNLWKTYLKMIIETIPWFGHLSMQKTMNIHQKTVIFIKKTMKTYSEAVILSIQNIWKHTKI